MKLDEVPVVKLVTGLVTGLVRAPAVNDRLHDEVTALLPHAVATTLLARTIAETEVTVIENVIATETMTTAAVPAALLIETVIAK